MINKNDIDTYYILEEIIQKEKLNTEKINKILSSNINNIL